jgi:signal transduction histidine kinase
MTAEINMIGVATDGKFTGAHGSLRDITERERLEEDLRHRSAELAANQERASLARELHDSVTQALFSMGLTLRTIELLFDRDPQAARAKFSELRELQNDALAEMRTLIFELRPRGLETDGLEQALRNHAAAVSGRTGLTVQVETSLPARLSLDSEEALYRIGQEALHNVVKHANARTAEIRLAQNDDRVELTVEDDGAGFDPALVSGTKLGLIAMRQRAERLGGRVAIDSRPGAGTRVMVSMPVDQAADAAQSSVPEAVTSA